MAKKNDSVKLLIGIAVIIILALLVSNSNLQIKSPFSLVTKNVCVDNVIANYQFNGNTLDINGNYNAVNHNATFTNGKFGQAIQFGNGSYIDLPLSLAGKDYTSWIASNNNSTFILYASINGTTYANTIAGYSIIPQIGYGFGNGTTLLVDDLTFYSNLSVSEMNSLYASGAGNPACYTTTENVNISCSDYAIQTFSNPGNGSCVIPSGTYYPSCTFNWSVNNYELSNGNCIQNSSLICFTGGYSSLSSCQSALNSSSSVTTSTNTVPTASSSSPSLTKTLFTIPGLNLNVNLLELLVLALLAGLGFMLLRKK